MTKDNVFQNGEDKCVGAVEVGCCVHSSGCICIFWGSTR